jgi:hypothetical protein
MRMEIGKDPWAPHFATYLNGEPLEACTMADEEQGCAEVYADWERLEKGALHLLSYRKRMVFGQIEARPLTEIARRIKTDPENAAALWAEYERECVRHYG